MISLLPLSPIVKNTKLSVTRILPPKCLSSSVSGDALYRSLRFDKLLSLNIAENNAVFEPDEDSETLAVKYTLLLFLKSVSTDISKSPPCLDRIIFGIPSTTFLSPLVTW